ncbi:hypothetical protein COE61_22755 [Bacillus thuringiensis]|uniref:hypothetical protein n=1 Tax=Bacillus thuringiensis TaxID=1428 RepID=UPI000BEB3BFD|nr:hypothetical protein [Bacillus thuringiensis]PDX91823.1 hypothetical protein COM78_26815 [Bacillus thuringiensis]PGZ73521.1 hypothetical protein COE61_22755 [Bacillus thuringiensis]
MKNQEIACKQINEFLESDKEKIVLIKGTDYKGKFPLVLERLIQNENCNNGVLRFRAFNSIHLFFDRTKYEIPKNIGKTKKVHLIKNTTCHFDSFDKSTWRQTPLELDFALICPIELYNSESNVSKEEFLQNILKEKTIRKILLVSHIDDKGEYEWLNRYMNRTIEFNVD